MIFETPKGDNFILFSPERTGRYQTKTSIFRGARISFKLEPTDETKKFHKITISKSNFPKICGLFNLILTCEGSSIKDKLNNFKKLPKLTKEEIEGLKKYSFTLNSFNPDDTNIFSNSLVDPLTKVSIPFSSRLLVKSSIHENYLDLDLKSKGIDIESQ